MILSEEEKNRIRGLHTIKEDGHMDVPSAIRKCKLILDDAEDILEKLAELQEVGGELPDSGREMFTQLERLPDAKFNCGSGSSCCIMR